MGISFILAFDKMQAITFLGCLVVIYLSMATSDVASREIARLRPARGPIVSVRNERRRPPPNKPGISVRSQERAAARRPAASVRSQERVAVRSPVVRSERRAPLKAN